MIGFKAMLQRCFVLDVSMGGIHVSIGVGGYTEPAPPPVSRGDR